ncbi:hypothetical protein EZV62_009305 [Acer yangbiense]|uniref:Uncharacterized protein n=1 Tax=Acer yangbiense TaxID=1000413 RepID=A0A5C7IFB6_9ROSI|nr:hypothetical protein EZV62_009305 [Acer yangbiense]
MYDHRSEHMMKARSTEKQTNDQVANKDLQTVTLIYQARIVDLFRNITVTWNKSSINHFISINVENPANEKNQYICKIDLKAWQLWCKKGLKNLEVDGRKLDVYWDFRQAKFSDSPAPDSDYYVAIVSKEEVVLLLGDLKQDAYKRTKRKPPLVEATLLCKQENVYGKELYCTRATLGEGEEEHEIVIENSLSGPGDPEMWIIINGVTAIHVVNLYWAFRGNEIVSMNNSTTSIKIFWDVHDWLFSNSSSTYGLFMFNSSKEVCSSIDDPDRRNFDNWNHEDEDRYDSSEGIQSLSGYCHLLYAWKI